MAFKIIWSEFAEIQLDEIFEFYSREINASFANKFLKAIIKEPNKLLKAPFIGQKELFLKGREIEYRYLIFKNYKLIYSIDNLNKFIKIADIFDTRQNPVKLKRTR